MILDNEKSFESVVEIYGGFPLKENYLELGNTAMEKYGLKAEYLEGLIRMSYINRPYYSEEDLDDCRDHGFTEKDIKRMMESRFYADIFIEAKDPKAGITEVGYLFSADGDGEFDDLEEIESHITDEEYNQIIEIIESFLNVAVDCG